MVYLGNKITSDGKTTRELEQRTAIVKIAFSDRYKLFTSKKLHQEETY